MDKLKKAVAVVAVAAVATIAVVALAPLAVGVVATALVSVAIAGVATVAITAAAEIVMTDDIDQYIANTNETILKGKSAGTPTAMGMLYRMTLNILAPITIPVTAAQDLYHDINTWDGDSAWDYVELGLDAFAFAGGAAYTFNAAKTAISGASKTVAGASSTIDDSLNTLDDSLNTVDDSLKNTDEVATAAQGTNNALDDGLGTYASQRGHHPMTGKAFKGVPGYVYDDQLTISANKLAELGVSHPAITGRQTSIYKAFNATGKPFNMEVMRSLEIKALTEAGVPLDYATNAVDRAIAAIKAAGVTAPVKIPWGRIL
jgi:hypothetical protein